MPMPRLYSFRMMLFCLVLLSVLPALGIILHQGLQSRDHAFQFAKEETGRLAHSLAAMQERMTEATRQMLATLALMPEVQSQDHSACSRIFAQLLEGNPFYTNVIMADAHGEIIASAQPFTSSVNLADRKHFQDAVRGKKFSSGEYIVSRTTMVPAFPLAFPVIDAKGDVVAVLIAALDLNRFSEFFRAKQMPAGSFLGITDHRGLRLFRSSLSETFPLGSSISPPVWEAAQASGVSGVIVRKGSDGTNRVTAFHKLYLDPHAAPYMTFFVGVPESIIGADARDVMQSSLVFFTVAAFLALVLAWAAERVFFMPKVKALVMAAERFRTGDYSRLTGVDYRAGELGLLANALDRMAQERQVALDALRSALDVAEDASRTKSEFLANMSHEIRTPLNGVLGMLQLLRGTAPSVEQAEYIETAIRSSSRLTRLLSDILDLSRIESNKLIIQEGGFAMADVRQSIHDIFDALAQEKALRMEIRVDPRIPPHLFGDEARLRQILFNLVGNAIKFTHEGRVDVNIDLLSAPRESPILIRCTIADTGIGIPSERLKDVFEPFTQVAGSYVRTHQGAGLGLAIVRRLVDLMHGQLSIDSTPGEGTKVCVTLPFTVATLHDLRVQRTSAEVPLNRPRVLLVEDDAVNRMAMERILGKLGCEIICAGNGQEALEVLRHDAVDLVFMDVQMPVMDGMEATRIMRGELGLRVPVVAMTAYAMTGDRERFLQSGMDAYVAKPVDMEQLRKTITSLLA